MSSEIREDLYHLSKLAIHFQPANTTPTPFRQPSNFPAVDAQWPIHAALKLKDQDLFAECLKKIVSISSDTFMVIGYGSRLFELLTEHFWPR